MSTPAKTIDQLEATVSAVTYAANTNTSTTGDIAALFVTLRQQLDIHSGLPTDSPLRDSHEPEVAAQEDAALDASNAQIEAENATLPHTKENDAVDKANAKTAKANKATAKANKT